MTLLWAVFTALFNIAICIKLNPTCALSDSNVWTCNYIPLTIPNGITNVHIKDCMSQNVEFEIKFTQFNSTNWGRLRALKFSDEHGGPYNHLTFKDEAFSDLQDLEILEIHTESWIQFEPGSLSGLHNVTILDFSGCRRLATHDIAAALNGSEKVPNLKQLILFNINYYPSPMKVDREFSRCLTHKPIFHLDLSWTSISFFTLDIFIDLNHLTIFNISHARIGKITHDSIIPDAFKQLKMFDMSYSSATTLSQLPSPMDSFSFSNVAKPFDIQGKASNFFFFPEVVNISGINSFSISLTKTKTWSVRYFKSQSREIIMKQCNIRRLDLEIACDNFDVTSIKLFNLASNGMEYIHPSIFECMSSLEHLDLSDNNLYIMHEENNQLFAQLLNTSKHLKRIQMASNNITNIPEDFFDGNENLEVINLAGNRLTQVHFKLHNLHKLKVLNLVMNSIKIIDETSMDYLNSLSRSPPYVDVKHTQRNVKSNVHGNLGKAMVAITFNPLMCDSCDALHSVRWLLDTELIDTRLENITCKSETGTSILLYEEAVTMVQNICDRKIRNFVLILIAVLFSAVGSCIAFIIYTRRNNRRKQAKRNDFIHMIRAGESSFVVFLSYNSDDEDFVAENVVEPLNEGLQRLIDTDRNLVCRGDIEFRPGQQLHDELIRCIEQCTVCISVISNQYCSSSFCKEEFNQAIHMKTPVLLMMKDEVDVGMMTPAMKLLFRNNVRILWENNNGDYRLKTSWENVCESILNLAAT